jgi:hypothetical protein
VTARTVAALISRSDTSIWVAVGIGTDCFSEG